MVRTQIQLDEAQLKGLKALAARRSCSISHLIREGVDHVLKVAGQDRRWSALWGAVGAFRDQQGDADVAAEHDSYLSKIYSHE